MTTPITITTIFGFDIVQSPYVPKDEIWIGNTKKEISFDFNKVIETTVFDIQGKIINVA